VEGTSNNIITNKNNTANAGNVLLAGVLLKLGSLGMIRYLIPIFPAFVIKIFPFVAVLCIVSLFINTLSTLRQIN
jgi:NADH:ubiquinone oxidoreductase subunit 4 (subunit M)